MRAILLGAVAAAAVICVPDADPAASDAVASHCERSNAYPLDVCYAVGSKRTTRTHDFILFMGEPYFSRYRLCVRPPRGGETCRTFPARQMGKFSPRWGGNVSWERNYPKRGSGPYRVTWLHGGHRLGPPLTFYARLPSYCTPSGDVCTGISHGDGSWNLKLTLAARYFSRYHLCVRRLGKARTCGTFPVKKTGVGAQWGSKVYWSHYFPRAPGRYRVTWWQGKSRVGPPLDFTLPVDSVLQQ
jgi:hypothetical protein